MATGGDVGRKLARSPATWSLAGIALVLAHTGYWLGIAWDDAFDPGSLARSFSMCVTMLEHMGVAFATVLAAAVLAPTNAPQENEPGLMVRTTAVLAVLVLLPWMP